MSVFNYDWEWDVEHPLFKAIRAEVIEECARAVERPTNKRYAAAIRALKDKPS